MDGEERKVQRGSTDKGANQWWSGIFSRTVDLLSAAQGVESDDDKCLVCVWREKTDIGECKCSSWNSPFSQAVVRHMARAQSVLHSSFV